MGTSRFYQRKRLFISQNDYDKGKLAISLHLKDKIYIFESFQGKKDSAEKQAQFSQ